MELTKLNMIQKQNNLNEVFFVGEPGAGGAYHNYEIFTLDGNVDTAKDVGSIVFQNGGRNQADSRPGVINEDLLEIVRHRLQCFQEGGFRCRENACALTHIEEALMWLNNRTADRAERGVLGTYLK